MRARISLMILRSSSSASAMSACLSGSIPVLLYLFRPWFLPCGFGRRRSHKQEGEQVLPLKEQVQGHVATKRDRAFASPLDLPRHVDGNRAPMRSLDRRAQHDGGGDLGDALGGEQPVANVPGRLVEGHAFLVGQFGSLDVEQRPEHLALHGRRCVAATRYLQSRHRLSGRLARRRPLAQTHGGSKRGDFLLQPVARRVGLGLGPDPRDGVSPTISSSAARAASRTISVIAAGLIIRTRFVVTSTSTRSTAAMNSGGPLHRLGRTSVRSERHRSAGDPSSVSFFGSLRRYW